MQRLILCADDFALSSAISETIVELAHAGKINAISCMTGCEGWAHDSRMLADLPAHVQVGLHLTLTGEAPLTAMPRLAPRGRLPRINALSRKARFGRVPLDEVTNEIRAQFDRFADEMGRAPEFVDGHQHAHLLPGIRPIVLEETARRSPNAWLRDCTDSILAMMARPFTAKAIGSALHSRGLEKDARDSGLSCNLSFAGHYDFASDYHRIFPDFLAHPSSIHLVMCHPGAGKLTDDGIAEARRREADALRRMPIADIARQHGLAFAA